MHKIYVLRGPEMREVPVSEKEGEGERVRMCACVMIVNLFQHHVAANHTLHVFIFMN